MMGYLKSGPSCYYPTWGVSNKNMVWLGDGFFDENAHECIQSHIVLVAPQAVSPLAAQRAGALWMYNRCTTGWHTLQLRGMRHKNHIQLSLGIAGSIPLLGIPQARWFW